MKKSRTGAWLYWDERRVKTDFAIIDNGSLEIAYAQIKSLSTFRLWLFLLHRVNGYTRERKPEGYRLGEEEIRERTGLSRAGLYRSMSELQKLGLIERHKVGKTTHAYLAVSHQRDTENKSVSHQRDTSTRAGASQKPTDSDPAKKEECVSPVSLIPISQNNSNYSLNLSERETEREAKKKKDWGPFLDEIPPEFKRIAIQELNAASEHWLLENPMASGLQLDRKYYDTVAIIDRAWTSILYLFRKKDGMDGLHRKGYPMGRNRKKKELLRWLEVIARDWEVSKEEGELAGGSDDVEVTRSNLVEKYRETWGSVFSRFGYLFEPHSKGHLKHTIFSGGSAADKEKAIAYWREMAHCEQIAILDEKMELAISQYGRSWFERGEY
jgi:hypothetical protein